MGTLFRPLSDGAKPACRSSLPPRREADVLLQALFQRRQAGAAVVVAADVQIRQGTIHLGKQHGVGKARHSISFEECEAQLFISQG